MKIKILPLLISALLAGCAVGPTYQRPVLDTPAQFKEAGLWRPAAPADTLERGPWWNLFHDPVLDELVARVEVSNQNVAQAVAAYDQARAAVAEQRASLFPVVNLNGGATRRGGGNSNSGSTQSGSSGGTTYQASLGASWEPDIWGRLRRGISSANAGLQASAAELAAAKLAAQGELVADYFSLREADAQYTLLAATIAGYERSLQIVQNRYEAGIVARTDVLQAQTQLANARAEALGLVRQRAQFEHAIAVLVGQAPANFTLAAGPWNFTVPEIPVSVPSALLERRPDIASAERRVAQANEQIGIAQTAFYPNLGLNASYGSTASRIGDLFKAGNAVWSLGLSAAQLIFDGGANKARVAGARAAQEEAAARYRQTVLTAFQDVEDQLSAAQILAQQQLLRGEASQAADLVEQQVMNRYRAGQVGFSEVIAAQATAQNARRSLIQAQADRLITAVTLIQALGGGWKAGS